MKTLLYSFGTFVFAVIALPILFVMALVIAIDVEGQERINRKHGEGEA